MFFSPFDKLYVHEASFGILFADIYSDLNLPFPERI